MRCISLTHCRDVDETVECILGVLKARRKIWDFDYLRLWSNYLKLTPELEKAFDETNLA
ncbi:hypothetical protein [Dapis sp. BLCC M229]|uniref:hypothetical protein n=1 Tax=Dapis sp. BLCC M229 TaxID=3400188 RepID=UPI003CF588B1